MMKPLVSVITPTYNRELFIVECIESVLAQTYENWEMVITDDCSTDGTVEVIRKYADTDSRIRLYVLASNSGAGAARNNSIKEAKGRYIAFLDSDDSWRPDKLEKQVSYMEKMDCAISYTSYMVVGKGNVRPRIVVAPYSQTYFNNICEDRFCFSTTIYDTEKVGKIYMPLIRNREDWGLILSVLRLCKRGYGMKEPLTYYRVGHAALSNDSLWKLVRYNIMVYKAALGWNIVKSAICFIFLYLPSHCLKRIEQRLINR